MAINDKKDGSFIDCELLKSQIDIQRILRARDDRSRDGLGRRRVDRAEDDGFRRRDINHRVAVERVSPRRWANLKLALVGAR